METITTVGLDLAKSIFQFRPFLKAASRWYDGRCAVRRCWTFSVSCRRVLLAWKPVVARTTGHVRFLRWATMYG